MVANPLGQIPGAVRCGVALAYPSGMAALLLMVLLLPASHAPAILWAALAYWVVGLCVLAAAGNWACVSRAVLLLLPQLCFFTDDVTLGLVIGSGTTADPLFGAVQGALRTTRLAVGLALFASVSTLVATPRVRSELSAGVATATMVVLVEAAARVLWDPDHGSSGSQVAGFLLAPALVFAMTTVPVVWIPAGLVAGLRALQRPRRPSESRAEGPDAS